MKALALGEQRPTCSPTCVLALCVLAALALLLGVREYQHLYSVKCWELDGNRFCVAGGLADLPDGFAEASRADLPLRVRDAR